MSSQDSGPVRVIGRPFPKGVSGNPGGQPKEIAEFRKMLIEAAPEACRELIRLTTGAEDEKVRVAAIRELLDRVCGKAPVSVHMTADVQATLLGVLMSLTPEEKSKRIEQLQQKAQIADPPRLDTPETPK